MIKIRCQFEFEFKCKKDWEMLDSQTISSAPKELFGTDVRHYRDCGKSVYKIQSLEQLDFSIKNRQCIAIYFPINLHEAMRVGNASDNPKPTFGLLRTFQ